MTKNEKILNRALEMACKEIQEMNDCHCVPCPLPKMCDTYTPRKKCEQKTLEYYVDKAKEKLK